MSKRAEIKKYRQAASGATKIGELIKRAQAKMRQTGRECVTIGRIRVQVDRIPGFQHRPGPKPRVIIISQA